MKNSDRPQRPRKPRASGSDSQSGRPYKPKDDGREGRSARPQRDNKREDSGERPFEKRGPQSGKDRPRREAGEAGGFRARKNLDKPGGAGKKSDERPAAKRSFRKEEGDKRFKKDDGKRPARDGQDREKFARPDRKLAKSFGQEAGGKRPPFPKNEEADRPTRQSKTYETKRRREEEPEDQPTRSETATGSGMTLNKYLAHAGLSSRRDAAQSIKDGKVKVNGVVLLTPGYRVQEGDKITFEGKRMTPQTKKVYVLLNKPKGFITTTDDEQGRQTVMDLVKAVEAERLFPVGRLDRNTTGLLLLTNDGDLAQRLTHPKYEAKKIYQVGLDKPLAAADFDKLMAGVELEDGLAKPDKLAYLETKSELGLEIHSGRNRIVRRMFEALGYEVEKLDRVMFAGLTKKNIPRGQWRHLTEQEVVRLKHFKP